MIDEKFHDRIQDLAGQQGKTQGDQLKEIELKIQELKTTDGTGAVRTITAPDSVASRLFIESEVHRLGGAKIPSITLDEVGIERARAFYGKYCDDKPNTGTHPVIDAILNKHSIDIFWKE